MAVDVLNQASPARVSDIPGRMPSRRGAKVYLVGSSVAQVCALVRYTVLARLIGPEQLGLAATLVLTSQFFESVTDSGSDRFLIQDRDGDTPQVQRLVQLVFAGRGVMLAAALVLFSGPIAALYHTPTLAAGLMALALSPLIFGFLNLDMRRAQRHNDFRSEALGLLLGESGGLCATVAAAILTHSYTAILYGLITRQLIVVLVSHLRAERRYELGFSRAYAARLAGFAAPLMLNGLLLFAGSQGDRVLVGNQLGLTALGHYSAVLLLIFYPATMVSRYLNTIHLPHIAAGRDNVLERNHAVERLAGQTLVLGLAMSAGFAAVGSTAVTLLYGAKFRQAAMSVCLIGILQTIRFVRLWPNTAALGMGRSGLVLVNNIARMVGLPVALVAAMRGGGVDGIVLGLILGELAALAMGISMVNSASGQPKVHDFDRFAILALGSAALVAAVFAWRYPTAPHIFVALAGLSAAIIWTIVRETTTLTEAAATGRLWLLRGWRPRRT
jgi:O-antigen/teichoic acid export membrane protein